MLPVIIGLPAPCSGAYSCLDRDILELVSWPGVITTVVFYVIAFAYLWMIHRTRQLNELRASLIQTALFTLLAGAIFIVLYSPSNQYKNLKGQYDDSIKRQETSELVLQKPERI